MKSDMVYGVFFVNDDGEEELCLGFGNEKWAEFICDKLNKRLPYGGGNSFFIVAKIPRKECRVEMYEHGMTVVEFNNFVNRFE